MRFVLGQEIINIIRGKVVDLDIMAKKKLSIERNLKSIRTLILGSSHLNNAYLPVENEFNLAMPSQDLYYSYELLKKYDTPDIKNIVVSFSVFTPGHQVIKTSQIHKALLYKNLFGIEYQFPDYAKGKHLYEREFIYKFLINRYLKKVKNIENYRGEIEKYFVSDKKTSEAYRKIYISGNLKNNQRENEQTEYAKKIVEYSKEKNKNLFWLITPHSQEYINNIPPKDVLFKKLYEICTNQDRVWILNLYDDKRFLHEDFLDIDHLNKNGAEKFTKIAREFIANKSSVAV